MRVSSHSLFVLLLGIAMAVFVALLALPSERHRSADMAIMISCCAAALVSALAVLVATGMWSHHNQILYIPAIFAAVCLAPLFDTGLGRAPSLTFAAMITMALLLGAGSDPRRYASAFKNMLVSIAALRELSPETERLLASGQSGIYARLGENDDRGHAFGLGEWTLACEKFHQYHWEPEKSLAEVLDCVSTIPTLVVAESFVSPPAWNAVPGRDWPAWSAFVAKVEDLLATAYICDADKGLRVCQRTVQVATERLPGP